MMGTNPMAWAVPRAANAPPICLDVATAGVAEGKLRVARARGFPVPAGNIVDREGRPTTEPGDFYAGGALLPFGGHQGSGLPNSSVAVWHNWTHRATTARAE